MRDMDKIAAQIGREGALFRERLQTGEAAAFAERRKPRPRMKRCPVRGFVGPLGVGWALDLAGKNVLVGCANGLSESESGINLELNCLSARSA